MSLMYTISRYILFIWLFFHKNWTFLFENYKNTVRYKITTKRGMQIGLWCSPRCIIQEICNDVNLLCTRCDVSASLVTAGQEERVRCRLDQRVITHHRSAHRAHCSCFWQRWTFFEQNVAMNERKKPANLIFCSPFIIRTLTRTVNESRTFLPYSQLLVHVRLRFYSVRLCQSNVMS